MPDLSVFPARWRAQLEVLAQATDLTLDELAPEYFDEEESGHASGQVSFFGGLLWLHRSGYIQGFELMLDRGVDGSDLSVGLLDGWEPAGKPKRVTIDELKARLKSTYRALAREQHDEELADAHWDYEQSKGWK